MTANQTPSVLDRPLIGKFTVEQVLYVVIFLVAVFLRTYELGVRPYHHDESIHAFFSWKITQSGLGDYRYDPVYHGPVLYYSSALAMWLFGDSDFTGRLSAVTFGLAVLGFAWPLRRYLGRWGALSFLILVTFSPAWVYFTRFIRHDIYLAATNMVAVYFAFRYGETRQAKFLYYAAAGLALGFCNKEDMYLMSPVYLAALVAMMGWGPVRREERWGRVFSETGEFFRTSIIPILTSLVIFAIIWGVLYTSFGYHPENWNAVGRAITYWWGQHQIKRIGGAWWYYTPELVLYEPLITFPALALIIGALMQKKPAPDRFTRFLVVWGIGTVAIYAWAQEKVPWLLVPQLLPLSLLSARWFGRMIETRALLRPAPLLTTSAIGALTLWSMVASNFLYNAPQPDEPEPKHETMLSYVQSTYDIEKIMGRIDGIAATLGSGLKTRLAVSGDATWPFSWYLRHYPVNWSANVREINVPVLIVDKGVAKATDDVLLETYEKVPFAIRGWWEPSWGGGKPTAADLLRFLIKREVWSPTGSSDAVMYIYKNPKPGQTDFPTLTVNPPPAARGYPQQAHVLPAAAIWGSAGNGPGQFNEPRGLAVDANGNLYVADTKNHRIQKLGPNGDVLKVWGGEGSEQGQFKDPHGIAVGPDGSVYVADTWNHRVQVFTPDGAFVRLWTEPGFWGPRGIAVAPNGNVFVTDTGNKRICSFTAQGQQLETWGTDGSAQGQLIEPVGIAVNELGDVIVADTGNRRLQVFQPEGGFIKEWPIFGWEEFYTEPYIAALGEDVFTTDSHTHHFARYRDGKLTGLWGKSGAGSGEFNRDIGIAAMAPNIVFVSDTMNNRIQKFVLPDAPAAAGAPAAPAAP